MLASHKRTTVALGLAAAILSATAFTAGAQPLQKRQALRVNAQMTYQGAQGNLPVQQVRPLPCQHVKRLYQATDDVEDWRRFQSCMRRSFN